MTTVGFLSSIWTPQKAIRGNEIEVNGQPNWWDHATEAVGHIVGASFYYRGALPAYMFEQAGMGGWVSPQGKINPDGSVAIRAMSDEEWHTPDVLWTQLVFGPNYLKMTRSAKAAGQIVLGDIDDDYWKVPETNYAHGKWATAKKRGRYFTQLCECDALIVSTDSLGWKASKLGPPVYQIRNPVDSQWITPHDPWGGGRKPLPCGWVGSTPWRAGGDLQLLKDAGIERWLRAHGERIAHCGHIAPTEEEEKYRIAKGGQWSGLPPTMAGTLGISPLQVLEVPHVPFTEYPRLWDRIGVSLVPLEDVSFNRSKSWLKGLESCAAGVPFIVSWKDDPTWQRGFPEYEALLAEGAIGRTFRIDQPSELLAHLEDLQDPEVRRKEGAANRLVAEANDIRVRWIEWLNVINDVRRLRDGSALVDIGRTL